jgi:hypothetical protein
VPVACLALLAVLVLASGYFQDDFAWLKLYSRWTNGESLSALLFTPMAQGTMRVFSERVPFFLSGAVAGLEPWPMRALHLGVLILNALVWIRILRSRGVEISQALAVIAVWYMHPALMKAHLWSAAINQPLQALFAGLAILLPIEGTAWLACFFFSLGFHELCVLTPLYALAAGQKRSRNFWIAVAAGAVFVVASRLLARGMAGETYALGTSLQSFAGQLYWYTKRIAFGHPLALLPLAGLLFTLRKLHLAMLLPLAVYSAIAGIRNEYYLFLPIGALALGLGNILRFPAVAAILLCLEASILIPNSFEFIRQSRTTNQTFTKLAETAKAANGEPVLVYGIGPSAYDVGFRDDPLAFYGIRNVFLAPGALSEIGDKWEPLWFLSRFVDAVEARRILERSDSRAFLATGRGVRPITAEERRLLLSTTERLRFRIRRPGLQLTPDDVGTGRAENGLRWVEREFAIDISGIDAQSIAVGLSLFAGQGQCSLSVAIDGTVAGSANLNVGWQRIDWKPTRVQQAPRRLEGQVSGNCQIAIQEVIVSAI